VELFGHLLQTHFALLGSALALLGMQVAILGVLAKAVFVLDGVGRSPAIERFIGGFQLEVALLTAALALAVGVGLDARILLQWIRSHGGGLAQSVTHVAILGGTLIGLGVEVIFSSFFLSILKASRTQRWV
jgi:hypothetical protein